MYNIYKHQQQIVYQESLRQQDQQYTKWLIKHQQLKSKSIENMKNRVKQFVDKQSINPSAIEDDHYKTWRYHRQYRDVQDKSKFIGFKAFQHKPNYDIGKYFTQRERKQISYLSDRSKMLIQARLIPQQQRSRSLRSQGPFNPKHTFRQKKPDHMVLQPRMRYTNITDKQRILEASTTFDDKFHSVYKNYSLSKSRIGQTKISPIKYEKKDRYLDMLSSTFSDSFRQDNKSKLGAYYQSNNNQQDKQYQGFSKSYQLKPEQISSPRRSAMESSTQKSRKQKAYFKTAKTLALNGDKDARKLMIETQYDRKKDLTNLNKNIQNQSFVKRPIL